MRQQKKKKEFNDLLIPVIFVLALLPFVTRLIIYDAGLSGYSWFPSNDTVNDFFSYYKSYTFIIISIVSAVILVLYFFLQRTRIKDMMPFIPIAIYSFFVLLSSIFSTNRQISIVGGMAHFESVFVLLGYVIMLIYVYQIDKKDEDYKSIQKALVVSIIFMCIIGFFQMIGKDLLYFTWFQKMIIPREYWNDLLGNIKTYLSTNAVSLTLFNPNYASVYLAMIIPFLVAQILPFDEKIKEQPSSNIVTKRENDFYIIIIIILTILLFKTYSRSGLISFVISLIVLGYINWKQLRITWKRYCIFGMIGLLLFVGIDFFNNFRYIEKIAGTVKSFSDFKDEKSLEEILTNQKSVSIRYNGEVLTVAISEATSGKKTLVFKTEAGEDVSQYYNSDTKILKWNQFAEIPFYIKEIDKESYIFCIIEDITWRFYDDIDNGYVYVNDFGKLDKLKGIEHIGSKNIEDIGSGRGYIWSRSIPLLKDTLLLGNGPDTFPIVFPQSDYVGKANNCKTPYTLIEKPHNFYLMIGIQTGIISLISFLVFYLIYLMKSFRIYKNNNFSTLKARIGLGCLVSTLSFMISGFFNDSSLQTTPIFIVLLGLGMDINYKLGKASNV